MDICIPTDMPSVPCHCSAGTGVAAGAGFLAPYGLQEGGKLKITQTCHDWLKPCAWSSHDRTPSDSLDCQMVPGRQLEPWCCTIAGGESIENDWRGDISVMPQSFHDRR